MGSARVGVGGLLWFEDVTEGKRDHGDAVGGSSQGNDDHGVAADGVDEDGQAQEDGRRQAQVTAGQAKDF